MCRVHRASCEVPARGQDGGRYSSTAVALTRSLRELCARCRAGASVEEGFRSVTLYSPFLEASTECVLPDKGLDGERKCPPGQAGCVCARARWSPWGLEGVPSVSGQSADTEGLPSGRTRAGVYRAK